MVAGLASHRGKLLWQRGPHVGYASGSPETQAELIPM